MISLNITTHAFPAVPVVMLRHVGPYDGLSEEFDRLWKWVTAQNVPADRTIGIYYDNPDHVASSRLRSAACVEVPASFQIADAQGLPLELGKIAAGEYATLRYVGPYEDLAKVWSGMTKHIERKMRRQISEDPAYEVYVNDASDTPPKDLITDLYMPLV
jgi:AraC family transcriptional regulator